MSFSQELGDIGAEITQTQQFTITSKNDSHDDINVFL